MNRAFGRGGKFPVFFLLLFAFSLYFFLVGSISCDTDCKLVLQLMVGKYLGVRCGSSQQGETLLGSSDRV